jgi:FAD:protein FMN transferase
MVGFRAMNTEVLVAVPAMSAAEESDIAQRLAAVFEESERRCSRFRPESELSRLNRAAGTVPVSPELFEHLARAQTYTALTDGLFDPAIGGTLTALGYDRSFASGRMDRPAGATPIPHGSMLDVILDPVTCTVRRPPSVQLDLGGLVKGATVDRAAAMLPASGFVDAGGDAVLRGAGPDGAGWLVEVEDPRDARRHLVTLVLRDAAVATTAPNRRRWRIGGRDVHHLIDPRVADAADSDLAQVTVVAPCAEQADVLAKTAFLEGARAARARLLPLSGVGGVLVLRDGAVELVGAVEVSHD